MSKRKQVSKRAVGPRDVEPRDVEFSALLESPYGGGGVFMSSLGATLTTRDAALVECVLRALLPLLDKEATV